MGLRKYTRTTHCFETDDIPGTTFDLDIEPAEIYGHDIMCGNVNGEVAVIGYLAHDSNSEDPTECCDGEGHFFTARRHSGTHREMQRALGLDSEWQPDLQTVFDDVGNRQLVDDEYIEYFRLNTTVEDLIEHYTRDTEQESRLAESGTLTADDWYKISCAEEDLHVNADYNLKFADEYTAITQRFWEAGRTNGTIGDKYAQLLDVYEHSGVQYSLSGGGMQCRFDTARGGAVWVPDNAALENMNNRILTELHIPVEVVQTACVGANPEDCRPWLLRVGGHEFSTWHDATQFGLSLAKDMPELLEVENRIVCEYAKSCIETYNQWMNGDVYGWVVGTYDIATGTEIESDSCWGYYGTESAIEALQGEYSNTLLQRQTKTSE